MPNNFVRKQPDPTLLALGTLMRKRRKKLNLDQIEVAQKLGRNQVTVNNWETGWTSPSFLDAMAWCELLRMDLWPVEPGSF